MLLITSNARVYVCSGNIIFLYASPNSFMEAYASGPRIQITLRKAAWAGAMLILLLPLVAMLFTSEVHWTRSDFIIAALLLFVPLGIYERVARKAVTPTYRAGTGVALGAAILLLWTNGAVGLTDSAADFWYVGCLGIGLVGALVSRFRARGMAWAMGATALTLVVAGGIALVTGIIPAYNSTLESLGITGLFVGLFGGAALLFWNAS